MQRALETGEPIFVRDVVAERAVASELAEHFGLRSALVVPLLTRGQCLGFITADRGGEAFELDDETLDVATAFGVLAAVFLEQRLEREELVRTDTLKSNFIALASHELRTPTAVVHGIAATLQEHGERLPHERLLQLRRTLFEHTERLRRLVDQLLDLSRLEAEAIAIEPERFAVRERLEEIVVTVCGERTPDVELRVSPDLEATADPVAFDRIVGNLITNALRYGSPPVLVSAAQTDRHFRLAVEDRGRGVSPDFAPRLFERFSRSESAASSGPGGSGLGLSIAKSYANAHGGDLLYEDADPHGARFQLVLPCDD
jgi:signal transduction histidine kinase